MAANEMLMRLITFLPIPSSDPSLAGWLKKHSCYKAEGPDDLLATVTRKDHDGVVYMGTPALTKQLRAHTESWLFALVNGEPGEPRDERRIRHLNYGADYALSVPVSFQEIEACVAAGIRRRILGNRITISDVTLCLGSREVYRDGVPVYLTKREFSVLRYLFAHKNSLVSSSSIHRHIFPGEIRTPRNVATQIFYLRKKLGRELIKTRRVFGHEGYYYVGEEPAGA